jgi:tRNA(Arg) A34 adenosine deaminase TadA
MTTAAEGWAALPTGAQVALEQQWSGVASRALPCGAAVTDVTEAVVASGRNHAYDPPAGSDALQHTRIAHAELNALAELDTDLDWSTLTLWSTQHPCAMCAAAVSFTGIGHVVYLASDPSDDSDSALIVASRGTVGYRFFGDETWAAVSTLLFLSTGAYARGEDDNNVRSAFAETPRVARLALDLAAEDHLARLSGAGVPLARALEPLWPRLTELAGDE